MHGLCRYWNDPEALQKFGRAMGVGPSSEAAGAEHDEAEEEAGEEEGEYEESSIIHHTASVGDVEVSLPPYCHCSAARSGSSSVGWLYDHC